MMFSIVIPVYNAESTIEKTIESVVGQKLIDFEYEIIIVDDASTDQSLNVISKFKQHSNLKIIELTRNSGVSIARNVGVRSSIGKFVLFLDSDDRFHQFKLSTLYNLLKTQPDIDFLYHDYALNISELKVAYENNEVRLCWRYFKYFNSIRNSICTPCVMVRRNKLQDFDEKLKRMEDLELWTSLFFSGVKAYHLNSKLTLLGHELNKGSGLSSDNRKMRTSEKEMYDILKGKFEKFSSFYCIAILFHQLKRFKDFMKNRGTHV
ncbi:putative glycosyltransferase EpsJ [Vibrio chagasii]|nr:putative glycosyltransferase EpsJ [Vibrio chagasii]CAH6896699.1 putative glycosyltransferase EpsJ [Vibrio chagasii]